jgi:hypothetical protein
MSFKSLFTIFISLKLFPKSFRGEKTALQIIHPYILIQFPSLKLQTVFFYNHQDFIYESQFNDDPSST